ncbi:arylesterase [bacterium]|nr:arylesterase [bacterium]MCI0604520.1 arylesterase [bacterium]
MRFNRQVAKNAKTGIYLLLMLSLFACDQKSEKASPAISAEPALKEEKLPKIVAFGNSLTAGLGLPLNQSYPAILQELIQKDGYKYEVINAGVSGDTTSGGVRRLEWSLEGDVRFLILELGGNDILRGQPVAMIKKNLAKIIEASRSRGIKVLLAGMEAPTNAGPEYRQEVHEAYLDLEKQHDVIFIPFVLKDLVGSEKLIQQDGTHPTAEGTRLIAKMVYERLKPLM